ncbi:MAG: TonB-dependent receptor [Flavobacteriales bacterium]|nr:TonB-dependent receptor [Flavobacteriales bacterium]MCB9447809.1 TonB-dependent receptor [Flavobacteriales bacterium]
MNRHTTKTHTVKTFITNITACLLLTASMASAQTGHIRGTVTTSDGRPAEFVNIILKSTQKGTSTNRKGEYEIRNIQPGTYTLVTSYVGLESREQQVTVKTDETVVIPAITLKENTSQLKEVVILSHPDNYQERLPSTSLRINTPLLETAQNIQIVSKVALEDQQIFDMLEGVQRNISGAQKVEHWDNYARINMRGSQLTSFRNGMNVHLSPWSPLTEDMSMVERIEFVKGPAGFMLANGEPGGFYNVVTKKPSGREKGEVGFSLGSFNTYRVTTDVDGKLSQNGKLLYRLNLMGQLRDSHRDFEYNNRYTVAPVLRYLIDDQTSLTLEYNEQFSQMNAIGSNYAFSKRTYGDLPVGFTTAEPNLKPTVLRDRTLFATLEHDLNGQWKLTAQAAYLQFKQIGQSLWPKGISDANDSLMQRGISIWDALGHGKNGQVFLNGKMRTGAVDHNILAGLDMNNRDYFADWNQGATLGDSTFNIYDPHYGSISAADIPRWDRTADIRERGVQYSHGYAGLYVQDELGILQNKVRLTLAGRYTTNRYNNPYSGSTQDGKLTPRMGISWSITENTATYFLYDQVFQGTPGTDWKKQAFDPLTGLNMEWGIKKDWHDGKWNTSLSSYQITKNNILSTDTEHPDPVSGQLVYSRQTGQQKINGVEFDAKGEIMEGLQVVINYAYTHARVTKDSDPELVGDPVAGATTHIQNTWLNYKFNRGKPNGIRLSLGYQYQAGRTSWYNFDNSEEALPNYFRMDGGIGYQHKKAGIHLLVNNILNEYLYSGAPYADMYFWQTEPKRNYRLTMTYRF